MDRQTRDHGIGHPLGKREQCDVRSSSKIVTKLGLRISPDTLPDWQRVEIIVDNESDNLPVYISSERRQPPHCLNEIGIVLLPWPSETAIVEYPEPRTLDSKFQILD